MVTVATTSMVSLASLDEILGVRTLLKRERSVFKQAAHASK
jgi:hypothetical protein